MNKLLLAAALPLACALPLAGCATVLTEERCEAAIAGASTAEQIAAVLVNSGLDSERARKIADGIVLGRVAITAACAAAREAEQPAGM